MFGRSRWKDKGGSARISVALIGEGYRRGYVRNLLGERVKVEAELVSDRHVHLLEGVGPKVVVLDCASEGINPLLSLPKLADLGGSPRVVALTDRSVSRVLDADGLALLGANATADIRGARSVIQAIVDEGTQPPRNGQRTLTVA